MAAFGVGAVLGLTTTGLPLNAYGDRVGGPFACFRAYAVLVGLAVVGFSLIHGPAFLTLKTDGEIRHLAAGGSSGWCPSSCSRSRDGR